MNHPPVEMPSKKDGTLFPNHCWESLHTLLHWDTVWHCKVFKVLEMSHNVAWQSRLTREGIPFEVLVEEGPTFR